MLLNNNIELIHSHTFMHLMLLLSNFPDAYMRQVNQCVDSQYQHDTDYDDFDIAEDYYGAPSGLSDSEKEAWIEANEKDWD